jgi:hypothetical protein
MTTRHVIWTDLGGPGMEHLKLSSREDGYLADGMYVGRNDETEPYRLHYEIRIDSDWQMQSLSLRLMDGPDGSGELALAVDSNCRWHTADGESVPALEGCHEIDIFATPFTNTLPIRRLGLAAGESAEISVAYFDAPGLEPRPVRQRYECIRPFGPDTGLYRYEALFRTGSPVEIEVDADGLIINYPGSFERAWAG